MVAKAKARVSASSVVALDTLHANARKVIAKVKVGEKAKVWNASSVVGHTLPVNVLREEARAAAPQAPWPVG